MQPQNNNPQDNQPTDVSSTATEFIIHPPKKHKYQWVSYVFLFVIIALSIYLMLEMAKSFNEGQMLSLPELFAQTKWNYFVFAIITMFAVVALDAAKFYILIYVTHQQFAFRTSLKVALLGKYYDAITPFSTGGQPMQIYYLHKKGLSGGNSTAVTFGKYAFQMIATGVVGLTFMILGSKSVNLLGAGSTALKIGGWVGWAANMVLPFLLIGFAFTPKIVNAIVGFFLKIGKKLRLIKDIDKARGKVDKVVADYSLGFKVLGRRPFMVVLLFLVCVLEPICLGLFPYFLLVAFGGTAIVAGIEAVVMVIGLFMFALFSASIIPTPGAAGATEVAFTTAFSMAAGAALFWVVLSWRFMTFYLYIIIGLGITIFDLIRKAVRARRE
jgi:uncharacterized protein (TIRG00374 family)